MIMEEKDLHLRDYWGVLNKRRNSFIAFFIVVFVLTLIITFTTTPVYVATTKVLIEKSESSSLALSKYYTPYDPEFYETQYQLIKSKSVANKVVRMLAQKKIPPPFISESKDPKVNTQALTNMISGNIRVSPIKNSKLVNLSYSSTDPEMAALIVNSIAEAYMEEILEMRMSVSKQTLEWLSEKADEERSKLEGSERNLQDYMKAYDIVTLENRITMVPEKLSEVATKIAEAETKRKEIEALYKKSNEVSGDPERAVAVPEIASDHTVESLRSQVLKAEQNVMDLSKKYGPKHPTMIKARADLKVLKEKRDREIQRVIASIKNEYELARAREENLRKLVSETKADTLNLSEKFIQYGVLKREVETHKQLYDAIIKKIKEQDITQDVQMVNVWIVEEAETPRHPTKPNKFRDILLGLIVGLVGGIGVAFFIEYIDHTVKSPDDLEQRFGTTILGMVPLLKDGENDIEKIVEKEPQAVAAESYRAIRTAVLLSSADKPPKNILVTSMSPEDGKTVTTVNLAIAMAQSGLSVLVIDGDLRKPTIHTVFNIDNSTGVSTYLAGASGIDIRQDETIPNLSIMTSGPIPPNPSELLGSQKMNDLMRDANERFDFVLWDSAPLLTVTDSHILSRVVDGTIIVSRAEKTTYEDIKRGLKSLEDIKANFLGIVLNGFDVTRSGYKYQYYSYHYPSGSIQN